MIKRRFILLVFLFWMLLYSCTIKDKKNSYDEGIITYDIDYFQDERENPIISLLPNSMTIKFKDDKALSELKGWMGIFTSSIITDLQENQNITLFKFSDKKYYCKTGLNESFYGDSEQEYTIKYVDDVKEIGGFLCKKAIITFADSLINPVSVYYTDILKLKHPDINSPYKELHGILMEFQINIMDIQMLLTFNNIKKKDISDTEFSIPTDFDEVSREDIENIFKSVM